MNWKLIKTQKKWLSEERGTIVKDWGGKISIALAYPNSYAVGMANLGFQTVYRAFNDLPDVVCERVFFPEPEDVKVLRKDPASSLISVETQRPVRDFDILAFALSFENDFPNILAMLDYSGIGFFPPDRSGHDPFLMAGGVATFLNPEPVAPFFDFFLLGEAENIIPRFVEVFRECLESDAERREVLEELALKVPSVYVPSFYKVEYAADGRITEFVPRGNYPEKIKCYHKSTVAPPCITSILTPNCEFANTNLVEIGRGCGRGCRFCAAGFVYRPPRFASSKDVVQTAVALKDFTSRIGLLSPAVSDHPEIEKICDILKKEGFQVSVSSIRADSVTPELVRNLSGSGHFSVAVAPDAGSERLRKVINKNLSEEQILDAVENLVRQDILNIKLYFMVGLPTETRSDVEEIVNLVKRIKHRIVSGSKGKKRLATLTLSINSFVPKPFTPFQWVPFVPVSELKERIKIVKRGLKGVANVRVHSDLPKWAYRQAVLARGDRKVALLLHAIHKNNGNWQKALSDVNLNGDFYACRTREKDEIFPWDFIDHGVKKAYLWEEYQRALAEKVSPMCDVDKCHRCGVCK